MIHNHQFLCLGGPLRLVFLENFRSGEVLRYGELYLGLRLERVAQRHEVLEEEAEWRVADMGLQQRQQPCTNRLPVAVQKLWRRRGRDIL